MAKEVGEAYIDVHGDISKFRKSLDQAGKQGQQAGVEAADEFWKGWEERSKKQVVSQWDGLIDAFHSGEKIDWDRALGKFDSQSLDAANDKLVQLAEAMKEAGKISLDDFRNITAQANEQVKLRNQAFFIEQDHIDALKENLKLDKLRTAEQIRYNKSFEGMFEANRLSDLTRDFEKMTRVMGDADWSQFLKGFDSLDEARDRVVEVNRVMREQGLISEENADKILRSLTLHINAERERSKAMADALAWTNRLRDEQERYAESLDGLIKSASVTNLEKDYRRLADAVASSNWSKFRNANESLAEMKDRANELLVTLRGMGRVSNPTFDRITANLKEEAATAFRLKETGKELPNIFKRFAAVISRTTSVIGRMDGALSGVRQHIQGLAGINIFGDMLRGGLEFVHNIDRIAVRTAKTSLLVSNAVSTMGSALGLAITAAADLGTVLGGTAALAPAFIAAAGISIGVLVAALKDGGKVLKDLKPQFAALQDSISATFWKQAAGPIRNAVNALMPILSQKTVGTAGALGKVASSLADSFARIPQKAIGTMFDRMNKAISGVSRAMPPLVRAFTNLGLAGSKHFQRFSDWVVKLSNNFDKFIDKAAKNGDLDRWINDAIEGFKDIGRSIDGTFGIFNALNSAAKKADFGGLDALANGLQSIAAGMQSAMSQQALVTLFEGMKTAVQNLGGGLRDLGPAIASAMPSVKVGLDQLSQAAGAALRYVGDVLKNPLVQKGVRDFTTSVNNAVKGLQPAIKPFADSLGTMMTLLGRIAGAAGDVVTKFMTTLAPVIDNMGNKLGELVDPLKSGVMTAIDAAKPVLESFQTSVVNPLVDALKGDLGTSVKDFVTDFGKFADKVVKDAGPAFKTLVNDVLPNLIDLAKELLTPLGKLVDLLSPTLADTIQKIGQGLGGMANFMKGVNDAASSGNTEKLKSWFDTVMENNRKSGTPGNDWIKTFFPDFSFDDWMAGLTAPIKKAMDDWGRDLARDWDKLWSGESWNTSQAKAFFDGVGREVGKWWDETVGKWWDNNAGKWFNDIKKNFEDAWNGLTGWVGEIFGGGRKSNSGGGAPLGGRSVGAALGIEDLEKKSAWDGFGGRVKGAMGTFAETVKTNWNGFWGGLPGKVQEVWGGIGTTVSTKAGEARTSFDTFASGVKTNWDTFWGGVGTKVNEGWTAVSGFVTTKSGEVKTSIDTFVSNVKTGWDGFWDGVGKKADEIWGGVKTLVGQKTTEIKSGIEGFAANVKTGWDAFWGGVGKKATDTWNGIDSTTDRSTGDIKRGIDTFGSGVSRGWSGTWDGVSKKAGDSWSSIKGNTSSMSSQTAQTVNGAIAIIRNVWNAGWSFVQSLARSAWDNIVSRVSSGIGSVMGFINGLPGRISGAFGNAWGLLSGAGQAIMSSLLGGLQSMWGEVQGFVGGIAAWIRDNKGPISYDRVLLTPAGEAIMAGLVTGFKNKFGELENMVFSLTGLITDAFNKSVMRVAGEEAAQGLADGLLSNRSAVDSALGGLTSSLPTTADQMGVGRFTPVTAQQVAAASATPVKQYVFAEGAIKVESPSANPKTVAQNVLDELSINTKI